MRYQMFRVILFAATVFSFLFWGCGVTEPTLTPTHDKQTKQEVTTTLSMDKKGDGDTLVYLSKSKLKFKLKKEFTKEQIAQIDEYLATHEIPTVSDTIISPMRELCGTHDSYGWAWGFSYRPYPGKDLGIALSQDVVTYNNAISMYGFSKIFVWSDDDIIAAHSVGFGYANMMYGLSQNTTSESIESLKYLGIEAFYIDEPYDHLNSGWGLSLLNSMAQNTNPKKLFVGSYQWPEFTTIWPFFYGVAYTQFLNSNSNAYIMCDQYNGNCNGTVDQHWDEFRNYYGSNKNISNWLSIKANNGDGSTHVACPFINSHSNSWYDLLGNANRNNINEVWIWASGTGSELDVQNFSEQAWERDWLLRAYGYYLIVWQCNTQPCYPDCQWGVGLGPWSIKQIYKLGADTYQPYSPSSAQ